MHCTQVCLQQPLLDVRHKTTLDLPACLKSHVLPLQFYTEESLEFQERISQRNGLGNGTYFPPSLHQEPPNCNMDTAREEAELVLFGVVEEVLQKTGQIFLSLRD